MAANVQPIFTKTPNESHALCTAANTASDGSGNITTPTSYLVWTAGADGAFLDEVWIALVASVANTVPQAALNIVRLYLSTISSGAHTSSNTRLIHEEQFAAGLTADMSTGATSIRKIPIKKQVNGGKTLLATIHLAAAANSGYLVQAFGGDY